MPSRADVEQYADTNRNIRTLVLAVLRALWGQLPHANAIVTRDALLESVPLMVTQYGEVAGAAAADFYDLMREKSAAPGRFVADLADPIDVEDLRGQIRWSITPLFDRENPNPDDALSRLEQKVDEYTLQPGRDTIARSVERDPAKARWARVPVGKTCSFCLMLASRGAVYRSAESAGQSRKYHGDCDCTPTPFWGNDPYPEGYNPDALYEKYNAARTAASSGKFKPILAALRTQTDGH